MEMQELTRQLDITKSRVFLGKNAAFLAPLMCSLTFVWDETVDTAETDGVTLWWNPDWFISLPPETRETVLFHEIWHPARLHNLRKGSRDAKIWNYACDIRINNDLKREGFSFKDVEWAWLEPEMDEGPEGRLSEEQIYDLLIKSGKQPPPQPGQSKGDMVEPSDEVLRESLNSVVRAMHQARASGAAGVIPGDIKALVDKFLESVVPWEVVLMKFFTDLLDTYYSWARPNRRYPHIYMPSLMDDEGRLEHLMYFIDVSGSVSQKDIVRCNSEVKYIKDVLNPKKLTLVLFDTVIQDEFVFLEDDPFEKIVVTGRGGTSFVPVREYIQEHKPTAAVIMSDLDCPPMKALDYDVPIIWIGVNAGSRTVPFGELIHIRS